ncbi:rCG62135 [Rattus norvegicus]|uniref:RCG62135 n=1 Tax=Rattus norvegicus TaxID=10116 RepID=A6HBZ5_RAT|nr:rCG62135 [Rattus norvegicus]
MSVCFHCGLETPESSWSLPWNLTYSVFC